MKLRRYIAPVLRRYLAPVLRLSCFFAVVATVLLYVDYRIARASVMDHLLGFGERMAPYLDDARGVEGPRQLRINGVRLNFAAGHSEHPPEMVGAWYLGRYRAEGDAVDALSSELVKKGLWSPGNGTINEAHFGTRDKGGVAALDFGHPQSAREWAQRLTRFAQTGKLDELGRLHYVYYERTPSGGTRYLTVWSDPEFDLNKLVGKNGGDADGVDLDEVPRYPGSTRLLSADERGRSERLVVYEGAGSPETAAMFYRARMATLGWKSDQRLSDIAESSDARHTTLLFSNPAGHEVVVGLSRAPVGVAVTAMQLR